MLIAWPNRADAATDSGGSWEASLPLSNMATRARHEVARSTDATTASTQFDMDFSAVEGTRVIALANHNLSQAATWRITYGSTAGASDLYDTGFVNVWRLSWDAAFMDWGDLGLWEGVVDDDEYLGHPYLAIDVAPTALATRYVRIEINDTANADGYVQVGRRWASPALAPQVGTRLGLRRGWVDPSEIVEMQSGALDAVLRRRRRKLSSDLILTPDEADILDEIQRREGLYGEVLALPSPHDPADNQRHGFIGRLRELSDLEWPWPRVRTNAFSVEELP